MSQNNSPKTRKIVDAIFCASAIALITTIILEFVAQQQSAVITTIKAISWVSWLTTWAILQFHRTDKNSTSDNPQEKEGGPKDIPKEPPKDQAGPSETTTPNEQPRGS